MISRLNKCLPTLKNKFNINYGLVTCSQVSQDARVATKTVPDVVNSNDTKFSAGKVYHDFTCTRAEHISEFHLTSYLFRHNKTGSEFWYLDRNDRNNVFSINFRTTPFDSTGLPHILEHNVLCGSQEYPVRDPFFKMLTRSVATFMNAMTGPDYTIYPFSSMNETDFRNLQKIYLDAVFKPKLEYLDFLQEGWRLEHENLRDKNSNLVIKGVVYNEMKGAFSENASIFGQQLLNSVLPDHTYGYVSGGNPLEIPKLTHTDLVEFHKKYYHPSNARFFAYGNFDLNKTLSYLNEKYLSKYENINNRYSRIPNQKRWTEPRNVHLCSRFDNMGAPFEKQNQISISLLMSDIVNIYETFVLYVLSELLIKGPNSSFYKSLIEPNFSGGYNQTTGYDVHIKDTLFSVGLQDLKVDDFSRVQDTFDKTICEVIEKGFDKSHIDSVLHNIELSLKHQTPQFGLGLLFNSSPLWNHEGDVIEFLKVSSLISRLRNDLKTDPQFLQRKVERYFKNNSHRLVLTMSPDDHYESKFKEAEQMLIREKVGNLTPDDKEKIYELGLKLEESQKAPPDVEVLPCLSLDDVKKAPEPYELNVTKTKKVPTQICTVQTNEVSYLKCLFDAANLTEEQIHLFPLFCSVVNDMGTKSYDYRIWDKLVTSQTSGIDFRLHFAENIYDNKTYNLGIMMSTYALDKNTKKMFELCYELLCNFKMEDTERLSMLIDNYLSNLSVGITNSGHLYAMQSCTGLVTNAAKLKSLLSGVEHIEFMKSLVQNKKPEEIMTDLAKLGQSLFNANTMRSAINTSDEFLKPLMCEYEKFIDVLPRNDVHLKEREISLLEPSCKHFVMNIPVNYCAKSFLAAPYTHRDHPTLRVLAKLLSAKYLLPVVREQNGAYGSGAKIGSDGIFSFFSYRDPNCTKTLDTFDQTYNWVKQNSKEISEQNLFEAKLGVLQQLDAPIAPGNKGIDFFLYGISQEMFQKYRQRMLDVSLKELHEVVEKYFKQTPKHFGKCVLGPENNELKRSKENWTVHGQ